MLRIQKTLSITSRSVCKLNAFSDMPANLPGLSPERLLKIEQNDRRLRDRHKVIEADLDPSHQDEVRRRRIIYRSKQRGWLEVDILLGSWAVENVPKLTTEQLDEYELLLNEETVDIYNIISKHNIPLPSYLENSKVLQDIRQYAVGITSDMSTPTSYAAIKRKSNLT